MNNSERSAERSKLKQTESEKTTPTTTSVIVIVTASIVLRKGRHTRRYRTVCLAYTKNE